MFKRLKQFFGRPDPLPTLGFEPVFLEADATFPDTVVVVIENDDSTPMEFVVQVLEEYFLFDKNAAVEQMLKVHVEGEVEARVVSKSDADRLAKSITRLSEGNGYPLRLAIRPRKTVDG